MIGFITKVREVHMAETNDKRPPLSELKGVRYIGTHDRLLRVSDFEGVGIDGVHDDLLWNEANDHFVPISKLNAAAVDYLVEQDEFELV